jgi:CheY-like chemotaxis protein
MNAPAVLVVDDNAENRNLALRMLKVIGTSAAHQAANAQECLDALALRIYDTVLMDISMPEVSGIDLCRTVRAMPGFETMRIVACTAHASPREKQRFIHAGFNDVLTKPFLIADLKRAVWPE